MSAPSRFTLMLEGSIEQIELVSSVRLNFDLKDTDKISTKIISIPSSIIRSGVSYCITLSKINSVPQSISCNLHN